MKRPVLTKQLLEGVLERVFRHDVLEEQGLSKRERDLYSVLKPLSEFMRLNSHSLMEQTCTAFPGIVQQFSNSEGGAIVLSQLAALSFLFDISTEELAIRAQKWDLYRPDSIAW